MKNPGRIVSYINSKGATQLGIAYNKEQGKSKPGHLFIRQVNADYSQKFVTSTTGSGKQIAAIAIKKFEDVKLIGYTD